MQQIADWLEKLGLGQYAQRFAENDISFSVLSDLTDRDLKEIGVSLGHRRQMLRAIAELTSREKEAPVMSLSTRSAMGEAKARRSATQKFIEQFPECCFCGGLRRATTREHMPPKSLFDSSHRPDRLVMPACAECNRGTSTADLTASIISRWGMDLAPQEHADHRRLVGQVRTFNSELVREWTKLDPLESFKAKLHLLKHGVPVPENAAVATTGPLTIRQLNLFSHKVALGLYFEHFRGLLPNTGRVSALWRSKEDFAKDGVPAALLEIMKRYGTLQQGKWNERKVFEYRFEVNEVDGLFVCLARLRGGLFVMGFAAKNANVLVPDVGPDWIVPSDLLGMMNNPLFEKKL